MRFDSITIRDFHPFREVQLDLNAIDGTVIAVTGRNGAGKTTLMELLAAGIERSCPTRGSLASLARSKSATLEVGFTNGKSHVLRHVVDGESNKGESFVFDGGKPVLPDTKVTTFDKWASVHLPKPDVLYASTFGVQGAGGFLEMTAGERKSILLRALGIEQLEAMAKQARERKSVADAGYRAIVDQRASLAARKVSVATAQDILREAEAQAAAAAEARAARQADLDDANLLATSSLERAAEARRIAETRADLTMRLSTSTRRLGDIDERLGNNRAVLRDRAEIEAAAAEEASLSETATNIERDVAKAEAILASNKERADAAAREERYASDALRAALDAEKAARARVADLMAFEDEAATVDALRARLEQTDKEIHLSERSLTDIDAAIEQARELVAKSSDMRIVGLRGALTEIASGTESPTTTASAAISEDDARAAEVAATPGRILELQDGRAKKVVAQKQQAADRALDDRRLNAALRAADRVRDLPAAKEALEQAKAALKAAEERYSGALTARQDVERSAVVDLTAVPRAELARVRSRLAALKPLLDMRIPLAGAEVRIAELEADRAVLAAERADLEQRLAALPEASDDTSAIRARVDEAKARFAAAVAAVDESTAKLAVRRMELVAAERDAAELEALDAKVAEARLEVDDWHRLSEDLGRDGLQALEIDAAGPQLTSVVNDLLRACAGSRWTVEIAMEKALASGRGTTEGCEVLVTDNTTGARVEARLLSGGQKVIVGEAVSLALALLASQRSGSDGVTLVRDESGAALDAENTRGYVAMLRRAAAIAGARKVLVVTHSDLVVDMCDAQILVADGTATVLPT